MKCVNQIHIPEENQQTEQASWQDSGESLLKTGKKANFV